MNGLVRRLWEFDVARTANLVRVIHALCREAALEINRLQVENAKLRAELCPPCVEESPLQRAFEIPHTDETPLRRGRFLSPGLSLAEALQTVKDPDGK